MRNLIAKPSPALIISVIALLVAISGTSVAATGRITGKQIKDHSITSKDLARGAVDDKALGDGAVTSAKIAPDAVTADGLAPNSVGAQDLVIQRVSAKTAAPGIGQRAGRTQRRVGEKSNPRSSRAPIPVTICPNGTIAYDYSGYCPVLPPRTTYLDGGSAVSHFQVGGIGDSGDQISDCTLTLPTWVLTSQEPGVVPALGGGWIIEAKPGGPKTSSVVIDTSFDNVTLGATSWMSTNVAIAHNPPGNTNPDDVINGDSVAFDSSLNGLQQGVTRGVTSAMGVTPSPDDAVFAGGSMACNLVSSGLGYPVLDAISFVFN